MQRKTAYGYRKRRLHWLIRLSQVLLLALTASTAFAADWATVGDTAIGQSQMNAVRLNDGRVLYGPEIYQPTTGLWSASQGSLYGYLATLTLLNDGRVLKVGHYDLWLYSGMPYAQIFDPATNTWTDTTNSNFGHGGHLAVRLADGRVLIAGDTRDGGTHSEIFDPTSQTWSIAGNMNQEHVRGFIELLDNGDVMVGGGSGDYGNTTSGVEIFDPKTRKWTAQSNAPGLWKYPASTQLNDGRILVVSQSKSYLYDTTSSSWSPAADLNIDHAGGFLLTKLADGKVLIAGGFDNAGIYTGGKVAEVYDPSANIWMRISDMPETRSDYGAALLQNGHVLLVDGTHTDPTCCQLYSTVLYTPPGTPAPPVVSPPPPPPSPDPIPVHISDLDNISVSMQNGLQWVPEVAVSVLDNTGNPVSGVTVTGNWSNGLTGTDSCSTLPDGTCTIYNLSYPYYSTVTSSKFTVTDVSSSTTVYDATANTDPDGDSNGTTIVIDAPTPAVTSTPTTVSVNDLGGTSNAISKNVWQATVTIKVLDDLGNIVANAAIAGNWSGGYSGTDTCTTNSSGWCSVVTGSINKKAVTTTFTVTNINASGLSYNSTANSDPDGDSNGTSITVNKP